MRLLLAHRPSQLDVLQTLADEHALHLLPPLGALPGAPAAYLDPPPSPSSGAANSGSGGEAGSQRGPGAAGQDGTRKALDAYLTLVATGRLDKGLSQDIDAGAGATLALPLVVHRLARHLFCSAGGSTASAGEGWRQAALLRLARACCGSEPGRAGLLRAVLCWDCESCCRQGAPVPGRVEALVAAVRASADAELEQRVRAAVG